ncbi:MAG: hypothetical protein NTW69_04820 [Chloroflexi bacterium]|jgi:hypothetical protein|nr:hypothetical protein [Chloroflexota bacterium]
MKGFQDTRDNQTETIKRYIISALGYEMFFVEPLYYHNVVIFERYGLVTK